MPPFVGLAVKVTFAPAHTVKEGVEMLTDGVTDGLTVMVMALETILFAEGQTAFEVKTQVTISPLLSVELLNELLFVPTFTPFNFHWKIGLAPPFVILAVKVVFVPEQMVFVPVLIEMVGSTVALTVMAMAFELAFGVEIQLAFEVKAHVIISPFKSVVEANVALFVPALIPLIFH